MRRKLKSKRGESLPETLAAILVISLGSAAFAGMVGVAAQFNGAVMERDTAYYAALSTAETGGTGAEVTEAEVTVDGDPVSVFLTKTDSAYLRSYRSAKGAGT